MNKHARVEAAIVRFIATHDPFVRRALTLTELVAALRGVVS